MDPYDDYLLDDDLMYADKKEEKLKKLGLQRVCFLRVW